MTVLSIQRQEELTLPEAANYMGIATQTLRNWLADRDRAKPECFKRFGRLFFRKSDLDAFVKATTERRKAVM